MITSEAPTITQNPNLSLREYQSLAISQIYNFFDLNLVSVLLYAPTGAGKTVIASKLIADYVSQGKRVMFLVHRGKLVRQTLATLSKNFGIEASVIWADYEKPDYDNPVQIAMLQTIQNRQLPENIDLVILDEAHTGSYYKIWQRVLNKYSGGVWTLSKTQYIGLSASPWRSKQNQGYCQYFQAIVRAPYPKQLIEMGHLCRARQFGYKGLIDESKLRVVDGEFTEESMRDVCTPALNSEIIQKYLERDPDFTRKIIAFCASVEQAEDLNKKFNAVGISSECIVGTTREEERELIFEKYASNEIKSLTSVGVLCEGFDSPDVTSVLVCRPVKSKALWVQMNGRGLRISSGKDDCWFLDFCGNFKRLGLPTDSFPLILCPNNKPPQPIPTKTCFACGSEIAAYEKICPVCGHVFEPGLKFVKAKRNKFEEILSPEQQVQVRFLRSKAVKLYNKGKPIDNLEKIFEKEFGYSAPTDWYDGLIFGQDCDGWEAYVQHFWRFLIKTTPDAGSTNAKNWIKECIQREFKSAIYNAKTNFMCYVTSTGNTKEEIEQRAEERIKQLISYKTWWAILEYSKPISVDNLSEAYSKCRGKYEQQFLGKPKLIEAYMDLVGLAIQEGIDYHSQDQQEIDKLLNSIKSAIERKNFFFVKSSVERLNPIAKQKIWTALTSSEKQAYRHWQETSSKVNPDTNTSDDENKSISESEMHRHIYVVKTGIEIKNFPLAESYLKNLDDTIKKLVWNALTIEEKQAFKTWQQTSLGINSVAVTSSHNINANKVNDKTENQPTIKVNIAEYVAPIKRAIKLNNFPVVESFASRLNSTDREKLWNALTPEEKQAYRNWQKKSSNPKKAENKVTEEKSHISDTLNQYIFKVKIAIRKKNFLFVKSFLSNLDDNMKQDIWGALSNQEKQDYRLWQQGAFLDAKIKPVEVTKNVNSQNLDKEEKNSNSNSTSNKSQTSSLTAEKQKYNESQEQTTSEQNFSNGSSSHSNNNLTTCEPLQLSLFGTEERKSKPPIPKPILKSKVPPPPSSPPTSNQNYSPRKENDDDAFISKPFVQGERVRYVGADPDRREQYTGELTVHNLALAYGKVLVKTADGHLSTWLDYREIKRI